MESPALAASPLAAEIGIVHFDEAHEAFRGISLHHHLREFVLELPCRGLSNAEPAAELEGGDRLLGLRHVVHGAEPSLERKLRAGENRSRRESDLVTALSTLIEAASVDEMVLATIARWADEAVRPSPLLERRPTQLLRSIEALKLVGDRPMRREKFAWPRPGKHVDLIIAYVIIPPAH